VKYIVGVKSVTDYGGSLQGRYLAHVNCEALSQRMQQGQINEDTFGYVKNSGALLLLLLLNHPKYTPPGHYCSTTESNGGLFSICRMWKFMDEIFSSFVLLLTVHVNSLLQTGTVK